MYMRFLILMILVAALLPRSSTRPLAVPSPVVPRDFFAVSGLHELVTSETAADEMAHMGVTWVRADLYWGQVEPTRGATYNWSSYDTALLRAKAANLKVLAVLVNAPWAYPDLNYTSLSYPRRMFFTEFEQFVAAAAERYDGDGIADAPGSPIVETWELFNEPDPWFADPAEYAELTHRANLAIKAANPDTQIAMGGLAFGGWRTPSCPNCTFNQQFAADMFKTIRDNGWITTSIDYLNFHHYPWQTDKTLPIGYTFGYPDPNVDTLVERARKLRDIGRTYGIDKPIICTEYSMPSKSFSNVQSSDQVQVTVLAQVHIQAMNAAASNDVDLRLITWFPFRDFGYPDGSPAAVAGFVEANRTRKLSYQAYQFLTTRLDSAIYQRPVNPLDYGTNSVEGAWFAAPNNTSVVVVWSKLPDGQTLRFQTSTSTMRWFVATADGQIQQPLNANGDYRVGFLPVVAYAVNTADLTSLVHAPTLLRQTKMGW